MKIFFSDFSSGCSKNIKKKQKSFKIDVSEVLVPIIGEIGWRMHLNSLKYHKVAGSAKLVLY